jgi:hypothetical protein
MSNSAYHVKEGFLAIGRTFAEYRRLFDLGVEDLAGRELLDCAGGASAFTATASELADRAVAVDPLFGPPAEALELRLHEAVEATREQLHEKRESFVWEFYGDVETRVRYLRAAAERFLADYATHPERYVAGELPAVPLATNSVDLALSANLLFLYDDRLDLSVHVAALGDLARVAREEVRVFPLASLDVTRSAYVDPVVERLRADGLAVDVREVPYEFQPGVTEMLVVGDCS